MRRVIGLLLLAAVCSLLAAGVEPARAQSDTPELDKAAREIALSLRCPVCQNLSVADSPSALAVEMRGVIRRKLEAGESRDAIISYFVASYGEEVLLDPPRQGFTLLVWVGAVVGVVGGLLLVTIKVRRALLASNASSGPADSAPMPSEVEQSRYEARLDAELARFERGEA